MSVLKMLVVEKLDGSQHYVGFPQAVISGTGLEPKPRLRVDNAQTSFFEGREFRTFKELNIAVGAQLIVRAVVSQDIILSGLSASVDIGQLKIETLIAGTPVGTFSETLPVLPANSMASKPSPAYVPTTVLTAIPTGGTHSGGVSLDIIRIKTSGNSNLSTSVGASVSDERGIGAGTYYFILTNLGNDVITGVFRARWEEVLPNSSIIVNY